MFNRKQTLMKKIRNVEISTLNQNENCLCYTLLFGSSEYAKVFNIATLNTFAYSVQQLNTFYRQKGLTFLFEYRKLYNIYNTYMYT